MYTVTDRPRLFPMPMVSEIYTEVANNPEYFSGQVEVFTDEEFRTLENE